jgi:hypothetical protein
MKTAEPPGSAVSIWSGCCYFLPFPGAAFVVKDHVGPDVDPAAFFATTSQEYGVAFGIEPTLKDVVVMFDPARAPLTYTSYWVALLAVQPSVTVVFTFVAAFAGLGLPGALGALATGAGAGAGAAACV